MKHFWEDHLNDYFPAAIKRRGKTYFEQGRVSLDIVTPEHVTAIVEGSEDYFVELEYDSDLDDLDAFCDCPWFARGNPCKHLWATALEADKQLAIDAGPQAMTQTNWKELLFPETVSPEKTGNRWEGQPGQFMLRYNLKINNRRILLTAFRHKVLKNGKLGKQVASISSSLFREPDLPSNDRSILEAMRSISMGQSRRNYYWYGSDDRQSFEDLPLDTPNLEYLLPILASTGRCQVFSDRKLVTESLSMGAPFTASLEISLLRETAEADPASDLVYIPQARLDDRLIPFADIPLFFGTSPMLFIHKGSLHELPDTGFDWLLKIRQAQNRIPVPRTQARELFLEAEKLDSGLRLDVPDELGPKVVKGVAPSPGLEVEPVPDGLQCRLWLDYNGQEILFNDPRPGIVNSETWTRLERSASAEAVFMRRLEEEDLESGEEGHFLLHENAYGILEGLAGEGWRLWIRNGKPLRTGAVNGLRVSSGLDWFDLEGVVAYGQDIVPLPRVIRAYLRGETTIDLEDGSTGLLPMDWLSLHAPGLSLGKDKKERLRFHSAHALLLDQLLEGVAQANMDRDFAAYREHVRSFEGVKAVDPPNSFHGTLRPYQQEALGWLDFLSDFGFGGILADDMGLGKTVQALAWLALEKKRTGEDAFGPCLVVAPTSIVANWQDETERFTPELTVHVHAGLRRINNAEHLTKVEVVLTTYGILRRDVQMLREVPWRCILLDESQAIKNPDSQTAKAARVLRAKMRICMTGTPLENKLDELWSQMQFLNPGILGSRSEFDSRFAKPIAQGDENAKALLLRLMRPLTLRRSKELVAPELPEKQESVLRCAMTATQSKVYARLRDHYRAEIMAAVEDSGLKRSKIKVLEGLLRLRQAACHPGLVGEETANSGKLEELIRLVREVVNEGHKCLIFSQFTTFLTIIKKRLREEGLNHLYFDGRTPPKTRKERVQEFQRKEGPPVFCISLKAGGVGLNLTEADYVFLTDPWWNPAVEAQAVDRTHRIGQQKKVFAYRLVSSDTVDEKVLALQEAKKDIAAILQTGAAATIASLTKEDIEHLLS